MADLRRSTYVATYARDDRAWIVQFRDPDIATFGRTLASAKRYARSALAVYLEVDDLTGAGIEVLDDVRLPTEIADEISRLGLSTWDVGEILGISGARVAQIERDSGAA